MQQIIEVLKQNKNNITLNSKEVIQNSIFIAIKNGNNYIEEAFKKGAKMVIASSQSNLQNVIFVQNLEEELPNILKQIYQIPKNLIGVTGTNGKTSVCFFGANLFSLLLKKAGFIGTIGNIIFEEGRLVYKQENSLTTPDIITFYKTLNYFAQNNVDYVFFEASSIGLHQGRINGITVQAAIFTNFTQDHLDYHKTMEQYFSAKVLLFTKYLQGSGIIITSNKIQNFWQNLKQNIVFSSIEDAANIALTPECITFDYKNTKIILNAGGIFQVENILYIIKLAEGYGFNIAKIAQNIPKLYPPSGRMELVVKKDYYVYVDYAHTEDSLLKTIKTLNQIKQNRLIVVFGCGGERDASKRPKMGKVASENADYVIITEDNPRRENAEEIRRQIASGIGKNNFKEVEGRKNAIAFALSIAKKNDIILLAGKGHENYQIIGENITYFSDAEEVKKLTNA